MYWSGLGPFHCQITNSFGLNLTAFEIISWLQNVSVGSLECILSCNSSVTSCSLFDFRNTQSKTAENSIDRTADENGAKSVEIFVGSGKRRRQFVTAISSLSSPPIKRNGEKMQQWSEWPDTAADSDLCDDVLRTMSESHICCFGRFRPNR